jgi:hypothetical protein
VVGNVSFHTCSHHFIRLLLLLSCLTPTIAPSFPSTALSNSVFRFAFRAPSFPRAPSLARPPETTTRFAPLTTSQHAATKLPQTNHLLSCPSMAFQRSRNSQSAGSTSAYHTIYCGIATDREGQFDHFIRRVEISHKEFGYWRFDSRLDEHRAYERGFTTPEDLLCSVNDGDGTYEDIILRWQPGQADTNMWGPRVGSAAQHLKGIYDARYFLNKTLALRGQIPFYPADSRLEGYWKPNSSHPTASAIHPAVVPIAEPASSPLGSATVPSPVVGADSESLRASSGSPIPQSSAPHAFENSVSHTPANPPAQSPPARIADSPRATLRGSASSLSSHMPTLAPQSLRRTVSQDSRGGNPIGSHYNPQASITQPQHSPCPAPTRQSRAVQNSPRQQAPLGERMPTVYPVSLQHQTHARQTQPAQGSRTPLLPHIRGGEGIGPSNSSHITGSHYSSPYGHRLDTSYQSPFGGPTPPSTPLPGSSFTSQGHQVDAQVSCLRGGAPAHHDTSNDTPHNERSSRDRPQSPFDRYTPAYSPEHVADDDETPIPLAQEVQSEFSAIVSPRTSDEDICTTPHHESHIMLPTQLPSQQVKSLKRPPEATRDEASQRKKSKSDTSHGGAQATSPELAQSPVSFEEMCQDLPCMDCGEDGGHKSDCYVGSKLNVIFAVTANANRV